MIKLHNKKKILHILIKLILYIVFGFVLFPICVVIASGKEFSDNAFALILLMTIPFFPFISYITFLLFKFFKRQKT